METVYSVQNKMADIFLLGIEIVIFVFVFSFMYYAMQKIDYSKLFKPNSTRAIIVIITFISAAVAFICMIGMGEILELIAQIINYN